MHAEPVVARVAGIDADRGRVHDLELVLLQHDLGAVAGLPPFSAGRDRDRPDSFAVDVDVHPQFLDVDQAAYRPADRERHVPLLVPEHAVTRIDALQSHLQRDLGAGRPVVLRPVPQLVVADPVPGALDLRIRFHDQPLLDGGAIGDRVAELYLDRQPDADRLAVQRNHRGVQLGLRAYGGEAGLAGGDRALRVARLRHHLIAGGEAQRGAGVPTGPVVAEPAVDLATVRVGNGHLAERATGCGDGDPLGRAYPAGVVGGDNLDGRQRSWRWLVGSHPDLTTGGERER